jgi:type I restriction enzyme S subunit
LHRILAERRKNWNGRGRYKEPVDPNKSNLPMLPEGWAWATIEQISSWLPGSIQSGPFGSHLLHSEFTNEGILAIGIDNVRDGIFSMGANHRITRQKYTQLEKFTARPLDVVVTVMATIGRVCVLPETLERSIITKHCYRITPSHSGVNSRFLSLCLRADSETRKYLFGNVRGQTRPGLNGGILKAAPVYLTPIGRASKSSSGSRAAAERSGGVGSGGCGQPAASHTLRQSILQTALLVNYEPRTLAQIRQTAQFVFQRA